ncbi:MAG: hypothetical protein O8C61_07720 [Candidatus Methanoperedens sp.]|nr:hypothetical protein [Candidatus Methanoperedens sp.]
MNEKGYESPRVIMLSVFPSDIIDAMHENKSGIIVTPCACACGPDGVSRKKP